MQGEVIDETIEALKAFGATEEQIAAEKKNKRTYDCIVWEDNREIVNMFWKLSTQWYVSMAGLSGINYKSLEYLCKIYTVKDSVAMFEGIQVMEYEALNTKHCQLCKRIKNNGKATDAIRYRSNNYRCR